MAETHSASTTLDDIINELKLTYDSSVGLLDGDSLRSIPNVNTLLNLNKLLNNLSRELNDVESSDDAVLLKINQALKLEESEPESNDEDSGVEGKSENSNKKRSYSDAAAGDGSDHDEDDDEDLVSLSKRRKLSNSKVKIEDDDEAGRIKQDESERLNSKDDPVPPVQTGSYTKDNDTRLKNPKSEFVASQTLSAEAIAELGLFSEENNGLETQGKEYLKKKYGVASYPENDLQNLLPGTIPDIDFSKNKAPNNQVQFTTFQSYIESYFRPFSNEDLELLGERNIIPPGFEKSDYDPDVTPFVIPKLGRFYADAWADEDSTLSSKLNTPAYQQSPADSYKPRGSIDNLNDDTLYTEEISCGPLSSRLLSAILSTREGLSDDESKDIDGNTNIDITNNSEERILTGNEDGDEEVATQLDSGEDYKVATEVNDFHSIEERLKRELKYIGIFMNLPLSDEDANIKSKNGRLPKKSSASIIDNDEWVKNKEDDEVCAEIRANQKELKEVVSRNRSNRKKLIPIIEEQIAYQEYCTILEDLDKQVDQAYMKRLKGKSKKKKVDTTTPQQQAVNSGLRALLEKRQRWIDNIGKLFKPGEVMKRIPSESILVKEGTVEQETIDEDVADNTTSAVDILS
ncbi:histone acetyltransferase transcription factor [Scheffersomyces xylosifermentans]|uniref:histone acetyltransferase transcription factor n=1 Tax=Scheffersomyces xylosifermentans TaxID=1304137 RepID=UPI00315CADDD